MKDERQIRERIEEYRAQIEDIRKFIDKGVGMQKQQLYVSWIRETLEKIEVLKWVLR